MSFHNLKFDKNFVKYYCKKLKGTETLWNQFFSVNSNKRFTERLANTSRESILNQNETWQFVKKNLFILRDYFCCKSVCCRRLLSLVTKGSRGYSIYRNLEKCCDFFSSRLNEQKEKLNKLNVRNFDKLMKHEKKLKWKL